MMARSMSRLAAARAATAAAAPRPKVKKADAMAAARMTSCAMTTPLRTTTAPAPDAPKAPLLAALFLFRVIYTLIPFMIGLALLAWTEISAFRDRRQVARLEAAAGD